MKNKKIVVITGANTGLGYSLVKKMCDLYNENAVVFLTARDERKGKAAIRELNKLGLKPEFYLLDVANDESIAEFSKYLKDTYDGIDIMFHNAAARISPTLLQKEQIENFITTNNFGTTKIIKNFYPLLKDNSRFFIVASGFGSLSNLDERLHDRFDIFKMSLDDIDNVMSQYIIDVKSGTDKEIGWPEWMNITSKIGQVASSKILARMMRELKSMERNISVAAVCPGLMDTDASRPWFKDMSSAKLPDDAAEDLIWLASQNEWSEERYGVLIQYRKVIPWSSEIK